MVNINANIFPKAIPGLPQDLSKTVYAVDRGFYIFNKRLRGIMG
jgi:hypothetical protein